MPDDRDVDIPDDRNVDMPMVEMLICLMIEICCYLHGLGCGMRFSLWHLLY